jgi:hypothetical protein
MADEWYYTCQGQQKGPVSTADLKQLAAERQLQPTDLVWREGLAKWVPANTAKGLFPEMPVAPAAPQVAQLAPDNAFDFDGGRPQRAAVDDDYDRPRRQRRDDEDRDFDDLPRRRRSRSSGANKGLIIGLVAGGVGLVVVGIIVVLLIVLLGGGSGPGTGSYTVNLHPGQSDMHIVNFQAGKAVDVTVTSEQQSDVDLYIVDSGGHELAADVSIGPNSFIRFIPPYTGRYQLRVVNLGPFSTRSHVSFR